MLLGGAALAQGDADAWVPGGARKAAEAVSQGVREGGQAVAGTPSPLAMGTLSDGREVRSTLTTSATGLFTGQGLNATYERSLMNKVSGLLGANFSRTRAADGAVMAFGAVAGVDWFPIGRHNEGLRLGPRVNVDLGTETIGESTTFAAIGIAGEAGYNWIATNGITAGVAAGIRGEWGGITKEEIFDGGWSPYGTLNVGYSW